MTPQQRRDKRASVYQREWERYGRVPCFVCGQHVRQAEATLEHVIPKAKGGSDKASNLAISHAACNAAKGARVVLHRA